ncbi:MAG: hypothetical protein JXR86_07735 [Spirochaetales bacterium]|nr:hypothetical protein [Spirochaetales bacterium]
MNIKNGSSGKRRKNRKTPQTIKNLNPGVIALANFMLLSKRKTPILLKVTKNIKKKEKNPFDIFSSLL